MADFALVGYAAGANLGTVEATVDGVTVSTTTPSYRLPSNVTGLPRISDGFDTDTLTVDTTGLTGITAYDWREVGGATLATTATLTGTGHGGKYVECEVTHAGGVSVSPPIMVYSSTMMGMTMDAEHLAMDADVAALAPHAEATHIAVQSGNWKNQATWLNNRVPQDGARALIPHGLEVTYDEDRVFRLDWLRIDGKLTVSQVADTRCLVETRVIRRGGDFECGTSASPMPANVTSRWEISNRDYAADIYQPTDINIVRSPMHIIRGFLGQGRHSVWGADKLSWSRTRNTFELATTLSGAAETSVVLTEAIPTALAASGVFQVIDDDGERIDLTYSSYTGATLTITSADFSTVNATAGNTVGISFAPMIGDTSALLSENPDGWEVGDEIVIGGTGSTTVTGNSETERRTLTAISGNTVSWTEPLIYDHDHRNPAVTRTDLQPGIGNLTRNVKYYTENGANIPPHQRGHSMDMHHHCEMDLWRIQFTDMGRTVKGDAGATTYGTSNPSGKIRRDDGLFDFYDTDTVSVLSVAATPESNVQGLYACHGHSVGFNKAKTDVVNGCTGDNSPGWQFTHHNGRMIMNNNVLHDWAAGMISETGNETGEWVNNFILNSKVRTEEGPKVYEAGLGRFGDRHRNGEAMPMGSRALRVNGNLCMDCSWGAVQYNRNDAQSITPSIAHKNANVPLGDLQGVKAADGEILSTPYPFNHLANNEFAGMRGGGVFVTKENPEQDQGFNNVIADIKVWSFRVLGVMAEYVDQYVMRDLDIIAPATAGAGPTGLLFGSNALQMSALRVSTSKCERGIFLDSGTAGYSNAGFDSVNEPRYIVSAHTTDDVVAIDDDGVPGIVQINAVEPAYVEPSSNLPFKVADLSNTTLSNLATGVMTDTVSSTGSLPKPTDDVGLAGYTSGEVYDYANTFGTWEVGGETYIIFPLYFSDRGTGLPFKEIHGIRLLTPQGTSNGTYTLSNSPPVVSAANITTPAGVQASLDILALVTSSDPSAILSLSEHYFEAQKGHFTVSGSVVTYAPDARFTGTDIAYVWVEDRMGNATRVPVNITVT